MAAASAMQEPAKQPCLPSGADRLQLSASAASLLAAAAVDLAAGQAGRPVVTSISAVLIVTTFTLRPVRLHPLAPLDMRTVPLLVAALLLLLGTPPKLLLAAMQGTPELRPICVLCVFFGMAYLCISLDKTGLLSRVAHRAAEKAKTPRQVFLAVCCLTAVLTVVTSNDIVVLTLTPLIIDVCQIQGFDPWPMLFVQFITANVWSIVLVVGNPTNVIVAEAASMRFGQYAAQLAPAGLLAGFAAVLAVSFRFWRSLSWPIIEKADQTRPERQASDSVNEKRCHAEDDSESTGMSVQTCAERKTSGKSHDTGHDEEIDSESTQTCSGQNTLGNGDDETRDPETVLESIRVEPSEKSPDIGSESACVDHSKTSVKSVMTDEKAPILACRAVICSTRLALVLIFAALDGLHGVPLWISATIAWLASVFLDLCQDCLRTDGSKDRAWQALRDLPWQVVPFVVCLFFIVEVLDSAGIVAVCADALATVLGQSDAAAIFGVGVLSMFGCQILNNQPMTVLFTRILIHPNFAKVGLDRQAAALRALIVASNLGANVTTVGALAGPMWVSLVRQRGLAITGARFSGIMLAVTPVVATVAFGSLWIIPRLVL